jgi:ankyrin repeat protein
VKVLIEAGAEVDARSKNGNTPLHMPGPAEVTKALIEAGATVDAKNNKSETPLHGAALVGTEELVEFLLSAGANPRAKDKEGKTPFDWAQAGFVKGTDAYWKLNDAQFD